MAGTEQVVLGDLVYCKENPPSKATEIVGSECDDDCGDIYDSNIEDEIPEDIHDKSNSSVKVSLLILACGRSMLQNQSCCFRSMSFCCDISFSYIWT